MEGKLVGRTALVTGGSRGIGKAIAEGFAKEGAQLVLNGRDMKTLEASAEYVRQTYGVSVLPIAADVTDEYQVKMMVAEAETFGPIDVLVNNAGIHIASAFLDYTFLDFKNVIESNVYSVFHVTQAILANMVKRKHGRIINLASTAGKWGSRNQSAYNASKHAVVGMTRCLALEMAPHNILVNAICPWVVDTDMAKGFMSEHSTALGVGVEELAEKMNASTPLGRLIEPREVAGLAVYLASDDASYVNGQAWTVDGGYTMI
jgi:NAD(P)-dependent dehydrogenase (short-subunit alcohol dehydrogenase family)